MKLSEGAKAFGGQIDVLVIYTQKNCKTKFFVLILEIRFELNMMS